MFLLKAEQECSALGPGEVMSGAPVIGRSRHPPHTLAGPSPAFSNPKAMGSKPGTGNKGGVRLG